MPKLSMTYGCTSTRQTVHSYKWSFYAFNMKSIHTFQFSINISSSFPSNHSILPTVCVSNLCGFEH